MGDDKRRHILSSALETFFKYGYKRVSMNEIAEAAGISRPGLYLHFNSKEEVFRAAILQYSEGNIQEILNGLPSQKTTEDKMMYAFEMWAVRRFDASLKSPEAKEVSDSSYEFARDAIDESYKKFAAVLTSILKAHSKSSGDKPLVSPEKTAHLLASALRGFKIVAKSSAELRKMTQDLITITLAA